MHFLLGYNKGAFSGQARAVELRIGPGFGDAPLNQGAGADWALLYLDKALGTPDHILPLDVLFPVAGTPVLLGGYEQDRAEVLDADLHCAVLAVGQDPRKHVVFFHNCTGTRGSSGAPLIVKLASGWAAIGIQSRAAEGKSLGLAVAAVNVGLEELLPKTGGTAGGPSRPDCSSQDNRARLDIRRRARPELLEGAGLADHLAHRPPVLDGLADGQLDKHAPDGAPGTSASSWRLSCNTIAPGNAWASRCDASMSVR